MIIGAGEADSDSDCGWWWSGTEIVEYKQYFRPYREQKGFSFQ